MTSVVVVTIVRGRALHLERQARAVARMDPAPSAHLVLSLDDTPPRVEGAEVLHRPLAPGARLPLAAARNTVITAAADRGADLVVVLDADCLPEPGLLPPLVAAHGRPAGARILAGPVGRLEALPPQVLDPPTDALERAREATRRGPRPVPPDGEVLDEPRVELFWSLGFAVTPATFARIGGFDEGYAGYGGEDTDFAFRARAAGVGLSWIGGAWAHHQHHPVSDPPIEHLDDIVVNARRFRARWGRWPMEGWLRRFAADGLVAWEPDGTRLDRVA